jgi:hypothetical protein
MLLAVLMLTAVMVPAAEAAPSASDYAYPYAGYRCGYWATVQRGESWSSISAYTGVPIRALQAANPGKVRPPRYWLYAGESLWIPCGGPPPPPACMYFYKVRHGDGWYSVSRHTGVPVPMLQAANPGKVRPPKYWLYAGETLCIPDP